MASPLYQPDEIPTGVPREQDLQAENALREVQNGLRRRVLPQAIEQEIPDLQALQPADIAGDEPPGMAKLILGGILRQKLGVDIFAASRAKAAREAQEEFLAQTNNQTGVSLQVIGEQITDPAEREAFQRKVAGLSPLERTILEAQNPGAFAALPAETLKLIAPGSVDPTDTTLQQLRYFERMREAAFMHPDSEKEVAAINAVITRLTDSIGVDYTTVSPGGVVLRNGVPVARGDPQATPANNFKTPRGIESAIPGTQKYFDFVAAGYPRDMTQTVQQVSLVDKSVKRNYELEATKVRYTRERLVPIRKMVAEYGQLTTVLGRALTGFATFKDALGMASEDSKEQIRHAADLSGDMKNEFALLVQFLTGAAASENQIADYNKILNNWDTYSPTQLLSTVQGATRRAEDFLGRRFVYDELLKSDPGLEQIAPWEMSGERATNFMRGEIATTIRNGQGGPFTDAELRQQAINALAYEAGVSTDAIERIVRVEPTP
jgi:hypothetical protein